MCNAKSLVVQLWTVVTPALETAANASKDEFTFLVRPTVIEEGFAFTPAKSLAQRTARHALRNVKIDVTIADVLDSVWKPAPRAG